jgi:hypothetical protein
MYNHIVDRERLTWTFENEGEPIRTTLVKDISRSDLIKIINLMETLPSYFNKGIHDFYVRELLYRGVKFGR